MREPPYPETLPVEITETKMIAFVRWAIIGSPAFLKAITKGEALLPEPPNKSGSLGSTVNVIIRLPRMKKTPRRS